MTMQLFCCTANPDVTGYSGFHSKIALSRSGSRSRLVIKQFALNAEITMNRLLKPTVEDTQRLFDLSDHLSERSDSCQKESATLSTRLSDLSHQSEVLLKHCDNLRTKMSEEHCAE